METQNIGLDCIEKLNSSNFYVSKQNIKLLLAIHDVNMYITKTELLKQDRAYELDIWL